MGAIRPRDQVKLAALAEIMRTVQTIYSLTEQFATARSDEDRIAHQIKRRYSRFKVALLGAGLDGLSQLAGSMEIAAGRSGSQRTKARILREGVASIRAQIDMEERLIRKESPEKDEEEKG
jgi:hypothetical protein